MATPTDVSIARPTVAPSFEIILLPALTQVKMLDKQNGCTQAEGLVLRTADRGESWLNITSSDIFKDPAYAESFFLDEKNRLGFARRYR